MHLWSLRAAVVACLVLCAGDRLLVTARPSTLQDTAPSDDQRRGTVFMLGEEQQQVASQPASDSSGREQEQEQANDAAHSEDAESHVGSEVGLESDRLGDIAAEDSDRYLMEDNAEFYEDDEDDLQNEDEEFTEDEDHPTNHEDLEDNNENSEQEEFDSDISEHNFEEEPDYDIVFEDTVEELYSEGETLVDDEGDQTISEIDSTSEPPVQTISVSLSSPEQITKLNKPYDAHTRNQISPNNPKLNTVKSQNKNNLNNRIPHNEYQNNIKINSTDSLTSNKSSHSRRNTNESTVSNSSNDTPPLAYKAVPSNPTNRPQLSTVPNNTKSTNPNTLNRLSTATNRVLLPRRTGTNLTDSSEEGKSLEHPTVMMSLLSGTYLKCPVCSKQDPRGYCRPVFWCGIWSVAKLND